MCLHPKIQRDVHKVHTSQAYILVAKAPIQNLAYKEYVWEGYCST